MRDSYAYVVRKEQAAKVARDPVRLNRLHEISNRIAQLVGVAGRTLESLRLAVVSDEGLDVVDAESEKLVLIREKVEQARREADEEGTQERKAEPTKTDVSSTFDSDSWNLIDGAIQYTPTNLPNSPVPCHYSPPPPASPGSVDNFGTGSNSPCS